MWERKGHQPQSQHSRKPPLVFDTLALGKLTSIFLGLQMRRVTRLI